MYVLRARGKAARFRNVGARCLRTENRVPLSDGPFLSPVTLGTGFSVWPGELSRVAVFADGIRGRR